jgi:hypothetical protein
MSDFDAQEQRILAILGTLNVTKKTLTTYLNYLKKNLEKPCKVIEMQNPKNTFNLINFVKDFDDFYGLLVNVKRVSDKSEFTYPLADLEVTDKKSKNYQLLDDYSVWFVNYR